MTAGMSKPVGGISVGGVPAREELASLDEDEKLGAVIGDHREWDFIVRICIYEGSPPRKKPLPRNRLIRWLIKNDQLSVNWNWQVNGPEGQCCASGEATRKLCVEAAKACIDRYIKNGHF